MVSSVWEYCEKVTIDGVTQARCNVNSCGRLFSRKGSQTSGLRYHLLAEHEINLFKEKVEKENKIVPGIKRKSLEELIARLMANDGFSANGIASSNTLAELFSAYGYNKPTSATSVMKLMEQFYESKKVEMIDELKKRLVNRERFSTTKDEWSNICGRRYLNINLHNSKVYNLGLIRINGSSHMKIFEQSSKNHLDFSWF
jgi:hypothetical protein